MGTSLAMATGDEGEVNPIGSDGRLERQGTDDDDSDGMGSVTGPGGCRCQRAVKVRVWTLQVNIQRPAGPVR